MSQAVAHVQNVRGSVRDCSAAAGELLEMAACGDVAVVFKGCVRQRAPGVQSVDIPQTSQQSLKFPPLVLAPLSDQCPSSPPRFALSLLARVNLHHVFFSRDGGRVGEVRPEWKRVNPIPL